MCIDILRNPGKAIADAKKKSGRHAALTLVEAAVIFAVAAGLLIIQSGGAVSAAISSMVGMFLVMIVVGLVLGFILNLIAATLGGKGRFADGLKVMSYSLIPISLAMLASAVISLAPGGLVVSTIFMLVGFAAGLGILFRGVKELYATDMATALVSVLALLMVLFLSSSLSVVLSTLARLGTAIPV